MNHLAMALLVLFLGACTGLLPKPEPQPRYHALDYTQAAAANIATDANRRRFDLPTLMVSQPHSVAGFDSRRMIYRRQPHQLEYFAQHEWVDTPARMLAPLIVRALKNSGDFRAVISPPSAAVGDMTLETELLQLTQDFLLSPSQVHLTIHVTLVETASRRVLAWKEFAASAPANRDDPQAGVVAANQAVQQVMSQLIGFTNAAVANRQTAD
jgi:cholesterol transport system auxiliary component